MSKNYFTNVSELQEGEIWKDVINFEGIYQISNKGRFRSLDRRARISRGTRKVSGKNIEPRPMGKIGKYLAVSLHDAKRKINKHASIHRLVLEAFVSLCPEGMEARHIDGNPKNNNLENLCWGTRSENACDRVRHGTHNPFNKFVLTLDQVKEIERLFATGDFSRRDLAKMFHVSPPTVNHIINGTSWGERCRGTRTI